MKMYLKKTIILLLIILLVNILFSTRTYALQKMMEDADFFLGKGDPIESVINTENLKKTSDTFFRAFTLVAIAIAAAVGVSIGIKYVYESAEGQAKLKEAFIPYIFGCIIAFGAFSIWRIVIDFGNSQNFLKEEYTYQEAEDSFKESYEKLIAEASPWEEDSKEIEEAWNYIRFVLKDGKSDIEIMSTETDKLVWKLYIAHLSTLSIDTVERQWEEFLTRKGMLEYKDNEGYFARCRQSKGYEYYYKSFYNLAHGVGVI